MAMKKILIADATAAQLREFARDALGLQDVKDTANKQTLTAQIATCWEQNYVLASEPVVDSTMAARRESRSRLSEEMPPEDQRAEKVTVVINIQDEPGGDRPVELSVNGRVMLVERGKEQEITWPYYEALRHAEQHFHDPMPTDNGQPGGINPIPRKVLRYPFQRVA